MLCRNFELIPIKIGFLKFLKVAPKSGQRPCTIVRVFGQISSKMTRKEFSIFIIFPDALYIFLCCLEILS